MTTTRLSLTKTVLATIAVAGLMTGATACGGSDSSSTDIDKQALVELLLAAAQAGDSDELAAIVAQADPDLVAQVLPEVRDELGSPLPPIVAAGDDDSANVPVDDSTSDPVVDTQTDQPSDPQPSPSDPSSPPTSSVVTLPGGASIPTSTLPRVSLPTPSSSTPSVSIPNISLPGLTPLPSPNLPTSEPANPVVRELLIFEGEWYYTQPTHQLVEYVVSGPAEIVEVRYKLTTDPNNRTEYKVRAVKWDPRCEGSCLWVAQLPLAAPRCTFTGIASSSVADTTYTNRTAC
ncbi:MAG: hypothetical protein O3B66_07695 [Actinomycetota bacterium]|nr:hypothetical protein [Actinomycetota bacterium]MDA3012440.1 hypothetical protein [Actinomycetota bacterium]MDA3025309.1 hypothetical protein [Actinomycetota bacterium]